MDLQPFFVLKGDSLVSGAFAEDRLVGDCATEDEAVMLAREHFAKHGDQLVVQRMPERLLVAQLTRCYLCQGLSLMRRDPAERSPARAAMLVVQTHAASCGLECGMSPWVKGSSPDERHGMTPPASAVMLAADRVATAWCPKCGMVHRIPAPGAKN